MKVIYVLSLIIFAISLSLIIEYPNSGRLNLIAGVLTMFGFLLNIIAFTMKKA